MPRTKGRPRTQAPFPVTGQLDPRPYRVARAPVPVEPVPAFEAPSPSGEGHKEEP